MDKKILEYLTKLIIGVLLVIGIWWLVQCQCVNLASFRPAALRQYIQSFGQFAGPVYILAYALNTISVFPPIAALSLTAGLTFGEVWGAAYLMSAALIGTSCTFFISRLFGRNFVERISKGRFKKLDEKLEKNGFMTILFLRVIPIVPYEVLNYACGLSRIRFEDYFLATFLGLIPGVIVAAFFGGSLGEIDTFSDMLKPKPLIAMGLIFLILFVPVLYKTLKARRKK